MLKKILKLTIYGIIEGITEWLPISRTGHLIILDRFIKLNLKPTFNEFFLVFIQLGAVMAAFTKFYKKLIPIEINNGIKFNQKTIKLWIKIVIACIPAVIIGILFDEIINKYFYNIKSVSISLIVVGIIFIVISKVKYKKINTNISNKNALYIGLFQVFSAVFPGVSRSGSTIIGAELLGYNRETATEFSFYLAIPIMFGATILKLFKLVNNGITISLQEIFILIYSALIAYLVSIIVINFLTSFIKNHSFKIFGFYRIFLGFLILLLI